MDRGRFTYLARLALLAFCAAGAGCGSKRGSQDGAAADGAPGDVTPITGGSCDPGLQDCPMGGKCDFSCSGTTLVIGCRSDTGADIELGMICGGSRMCKKGSGCFAAAAASGGNAVCRKYCSTDNDCSTGQCQAATITISCGGAPSVATMKICI
jgi:hypothetical protein